MDIDLRFDLRFDPGHNLSHNDSVNGTGYDHEGCHDPIECPAVQAFFCLLYTTIFVLGVFGNVLVCYVVGRNRAMQTVTNFFITNLALSDILLCILAVPFTPLYSFLGQWIFGRVLCHLVAYAQGTSVYISTLTLTSIAIDRYFVIIYPFQPRMKQSTCLYIILFIWTFSLAVTLPYGLYMSFRDSLCEEAWPSESFRQIYSGVTTVLQFLVPLVVIAFCYICVSVRLSDHARLRPGCKSSRKEEADRERKRRTNRMLIAMVTVFGISWMPLNVINLLNDYHAKTGTWHYYNLVFFMVHALAMSSTCYNPFLYAWLNDNFRKEFKQVLPCFDPSAVQGCGHACGGACAGHHTYHTGTDGLGCLEAGRGGLGGDLTLAGRRSISSAVRTMTTTDDWINNKSASHSPPTPTGPAGAGAGAGQQPAANHLSQSRDSSPESGVPMTSMSMSMSMGPRRNRKADSVEVESVVMETNVNCRTEPEVDPESPTSAAQEQNARGAAAAAAAALGAAPAAVPGAAPGRSKQHRGNKSRLFGSAARPGHPAPHRSNRASASLLLNNEAAT